jgi:hypothetical protein
MNQSFTFTPCSVVAEIQRFNNMKLSLGLCLVLVLVLSLTIPEVESK